MTASNATNTKPVLYWSERGQIGCLLPGHAPYRGSDSWVFERWKKVTPREAAEFQRDVGRPIACEVCSANARNATAAS